MSITIKAGYSKDAAALATVADRAEAREWAEENGYGPLSIQMDPNEFRVAKLTTAAEWSDPNRKA